MNTVVDDEWEEFLNNNVVNKKEIEMPKKKTSINL